MVKKFSFLLFLLLFYCNVVAASSIKDNFTLIKDKYISNKKIYNSPPSYSIMDEKKLLFSFFIKLYQTFISPIDSEHCIFTLTCSQFMKLSIKEYGIIWGPLMGFDRLQRCHGFALIYKYYKIDNNKLRAIDYPLYLYSPWGKKKK